MTVRPYWLHLSFITPSRRQKTDHFTHRLRDGENHTYFPGEPRRHIWTNNPLERLMREIRRRSRVVGCFPDGNSALMLAAARLRHIAGTKWGTRRYMDVEYLQELKKEPAAEPEKVAV